MSFNKKKDRGFIMSAAFIGLIILIAALAPLIAPNDPNVTNMMLAEAGPSAQYPFGNDHLGRCMLSRVLYGARTSVFSAVFITVIVFSAGTFIGVVSGYFGERWTPLCLNLSHLCRRFQKLFWPSPLPDC